MKKGYFKKILLLLKHAKTCPYKGIKAFFHQKILSEGLKSVNPQVGGYRTSLILNPFTTLYIPSHPLTSLLHAIICVYTFDMLSRSQDLVVELVFLQNIVSLVFQVHGIIKYLYTIN